MKRHITIIGFLLLASFGFAQNQECDGGTFILSPNPNHFNGKSYYMLSLNGEILSGTKLEGILSVNYLSDSITINIIDENTLRLIHISTNTEKTVSFKTIETKASVSICVSEYLEKLNTLFLDDLSEIVINTKTGIPFLTFTEID